MLSGKELDKLKKQVNGLDKKIAKLFDALGDPNRFKIFLLLMQAKNNICVSEFAEVCGISVPAASQQLKSLENSGLIEKVRTGQMTCYKICYSKPSVKALSKTISNLVA